MTQAAVGADVDQPLDVPGHLSAKVPFNFRGGLNGLAQLVSLAKAGPKPHAATRALAIHSVRRQRAPLKHFEFFMEFAVLSINRVLH